MSSSGSFPTFTPASTDISAHLWNWNPAKAFVDAYSQQKLLSLEKDKSAREQKRLDLEAAVSNALMPFKLEQAKLSLLETTASIAEKKSMIDYRRGKLSGSMGTQNGIPPQLDGYGIDGLDFVTPNPDIGDADDFDGKSNFSSALNKPK